MGIHSRGNQNIENFSVSEAHIHCTKFHTNETVQDIQNSIWSRIKTHILVVCLQSGKCFCNLRSFLQYLCRTIHGIALQFVCVCECGIIYIDIDYDVEWKYRTKESIRSIVAFTFMITFNGIEIQAKKIEQIE